MKHCDELALAHPAEALLIKAADDELATADALEVNAHLSVCENCKRRYQALLDLSAAIESAVGAPHLEFSQEQRTRLERQLDSCERTVPVQNTSQALRRLSWAAAIAAAAALLLMFVPQWKRTVNPPGPVAAVQPSAFEVDGESFVALPYSNPDLPLNASHIVQMQVPVSSLADAGIVFEPISNEMSASDRSVLADVLLGIDGRPLGIHVLNAE
ncbi:MAG TPA: zf-HC2 domain-containing protein [Bryobacteraceae bacterium]|jgi:anti-sigma factor RsiW|nr:zf-HC2 domain-containing protein [Bryobacteraceae bacterium]